MPHRPDLTRRVDVPDDASIAGEEDPGVALDQMVSEAHRANAPQRERTPRTPNAPAPMAPGDEAPPGTPGSGEDVCGQCGGSGKLNGDQCPTCGGSGKVIRGIGGA
jgi:hypothetical protein